MQVDTTSTVAYPTLGERGATSVEYALLVTLIAVAIIGGVALFGDAVAALFDVTFQP